MQRGGRERQAEGDAGQRASIKGLFKGSAVRRRGGVLTQRGIAGGRVARHGVALRRREHRGVSTGASSQQSEWSIRATLRLHLFRPQEQRLLLLMSQGAALAAAVIAGLDEGGEERVRLQWFRL